MPRKKEIKYRACGVCGAENVPFGVDWLCWKGGRPVCVGCQVKEVVENESVDKKTQ